MSWIDELIAQLCPEGVEFRELGAAVHRASNIKWADVLDSEFSYIDLTSVDRNTHAIAETLIITSESAPDRAQQLVRTGDVIFGTTRPMLKRYALIPPEYDGQICSTGYCVLRPNADLLLSNFLFHLIGTETFYGHVEANQRGASYPAITDAAVKAFRIPIPPLEVQREIVKVLDAFTALEAELEAELAAELAARRQQYAHYRDRLLSYEQLRVENGEWRIGAAGDEVAQARRGDVRWATLGEVFHMRAGQFISADQIRTEPDSRHAYPCFGGNGIRGFVDIYTHDGAYLFIGRQGALCGNVQRTRGKFYATEHAVVVTPTADVNVDWAFHMLTLMNLNQYATKSAQPGLAVGKLEGLPIPIPPLEEQARIVAILDQFDALVNDLSRGLPAEIAARRQQYAHYRDRLLTFREAV